MRSTKFKNAASSSGEAIRKGAAPFVFPDPKDPNHLIGFEVDLAEMLAEELGVTAQFQQGQWENVPEMLGNQIDVALNGFERTPPRCDDYLCTRPYYAFGLQLMAAAMDRIESWKQLKTPSLTAACGESACWVIRKPTNICPICATTKAIKLSRRFYNGNTDPMEHVQTGVLDATVADDCAANYYIDRFTELKLVGWPVDGGFYVVRVATIEPRLQEALNAALDKNRSPTAD